MVLDCSVGDRGNFRVCLRRWRSGNAPVELVAAASVWLANAYLLAGVGIAGVVQDSIRRTRARGPARPSRPALPRAVPEYDARGAGEIPPGDGSRLRFRCGRE